jgi:hypothetical protein
MTVTSINPQDPALAGCMATYTGKIVNLWDIKQDSIELEDIAHGLAFNCRWNGHTKAWYSIAEHCIRVHDRATSDLQLLALFHDAEEAYWGDMIRPLKMLIKTGYPELLEKMKQTRRAIFQKFGIQDGDGYKTLDNEELKWDFQNLILDLKHKPMSPELAKAEWLARAHGLFFARDRNYNFK